MLDTTLHHPEAAVLLLMGLAEPTLCDTVNALRLLSDTPPPNTMAKVIMSDEQVALLLTGMRQAQSEDGNSASADEVDSHISPNESTNTSVPLSPTVSASSSADAASLVADGSSAPVTPTPCLCDAKWCEHAKLGLRKGLDVLRKTSATPEVFGSIKAKTHILAAIVSVATGKVYGKRSITSRCQQVRKDSKTSATEKVAHDVAVASRQNLPPLSPADMSHLLSLLSATVATQTPNELVAGSFDKSISDDKVSPGRKRKADEANDEAEESKVEDEIFPPERTIKRIKLVFGSRS